MTKLPEVISRYITAYNNLDVKEMLDCLTDDVEFQNISSGKMDTHTTSKEDFENLANMGVTAFSSRNQSILNSCLLYTSPSPRDATLSRMPSSA